MYEGLYSLAAPHSFKLAFQADQHLYEVIVTASSSDEQNAWRTAIHERILAENDRVLRSGPAVHDFLAPLSMEIEPVGSVFRHGRVLSRRTSLGRVSSSGSRSPSKFRQVIIRSNLDSEAPSLLEPLSLIRTRSMVNTERLHVLTPRISDRLLFAEALADVWTTDRLPILGLQIGKHSLHAPTRSASKMMKKLSLPLLSAGLRRRSSSQASLRILIKESTSPTEGGSSYAPTHSPACLDGSADVSRYERRLAVITSETEASDTPGLPPVVDGMHSAGTLVTSRGFSFRRSSKHMTLEEILNEKRPSLVRQRTDGSTSTNRSETKVELKMKSVGRRGIRRRICEFSPLVKARQALDRNLIVYPIAERGATIQ